LTGHGEAEALRLGERLEGLTFAAVLTSPLQRAVRTCDLAGFGAAAKVEPDLVEWNYGAYEGRTSADIHAERPDLRLFRDGLPGGKTMGTTKAPPRVTAADTRQALRRQSGCGPVALTGNSDELYERLLLFDNVADPATVGARERYEAFARSVRDVLSQRWVRTEQTYDRGNPKRVYYLSMEFLIGRSLTNNITNMLLTPLVSDIVE